MLVNAWKSIASISVLAVQPLYSLGSGSNIPVCVAFAFCQRNCFWIRNGLCCHFDSFLSKNCIWQPELQQDYFLNYHWYFISSYAGGLLAISTLYRLNIYFLWWPHLLFRKYARLNIFRKAKDGKQVRRDATERDDPVEAVEHSDNLQRVVWSMIAHPGNRYVAAIRCHQNADRLCRSPGGSRSPGRTWPRGTLIQWTRNQPLTICHRWWWSLWWCCSCWSRRRCWSPSRWDPWLAGPSLFSLNPAMLHTRYFVILGINFNYRHKR